MPLNNKHLFLISPELGNQFILDSILTPPLRRRDAAPVAPVIVLSLCHDAVMFQCHNRQSLGCQRRRLLHCCIAAGPPGYPPGAAPDLARTRSGDPARAALPCSLALQIWLTSATQPRSFAGASLFLRRALAAAMRHGRAWGVSGAGFSTCLIFPRGA
jgi:hypothetical protein